MPEKVHEHKLVIDCPVAQNPEIFAKINGSISKLKATLEDVDKKSDKALVLAEKAERKVTYLYWFGATVVSLATLVSILYHMYQTVPSP